MAKENEEENEQKSYSKINPYPPIIDKPLQEEQDDSIFSSEDLELLYNIDSDNDYTDQERDAYNKQRKGESLTAEDLIKKSYYRKKGQKHFKKMIGDTKKHEEYLVKQRKRAAKYREKAKQKKLQNTSKPTSAFLTPQKADRESKADKRKTVTPNNKATKRQKK